jgi:hypothetical protein
MPRKAIFAGLLLLCFAMSANTALAHQPEYVGENTFIQVPDPETSRAYYGALNGTPAEYSVTSPKDFTLYVNILVPNLADARKDFVVRITTATGTSIVTLGAPTSSWQQWHEEFAGDMYWKGPEFKQTVPAGEYSITVSNPENTGKYVLAPGKVETFTVAGIPSTIRQIYLVKTKFFEKPWHSIFEGIIGKTLLGVLLISIAALIFLLIRIIRYK